MSERTTTRAGALRRLGLLLGGAGVGAAGGFAARSNAGSTEAAAGDGATRLRLRAPQLAYVDPDATPTSFLQIPSRLVGAAKLTDGTGRMSGAFTGLRMPAGDGGLELHTFTLDGGTLMGMGPVSGPDFSIVGGTGQFIGAAGAYTMEHRAASAGGDGSADFVIDIARGEHSWH
ncbi:MAG TPA: hypothetical protein VGL76_02395 [Gaiellaceae bacterium]|jgi:hypothetical protein